MSPALALLLAAGALAQDRIDTTVGARGVYSAAAVRSDLDVIVGERARWTLWRRDAGEGLFLADLRLTIDPLRRTTFEWTALRSLAVQARFGDVTLVMGRSAVLYGGPRLVDGLQATVHTGEWTVGGWGGLAPDLFTTLPRARFGGGPIVAWEHSFAQASLTGEVLASAGGLDRAGVLLQGRVSGDPVVEATTRVDLQVAGTGGSGIADAAVFGRWRPSPAVHVDGFYDAYSSLRYLQTEDLDPGIQRFQARLAALGAAQGITQDARDGTLHHLLGLGARWRPIGAGPAPVVDVQGRFRADPGQGDSYARATVDAGVEGLVGDRLDLTADATVLSVLGTVREEVGATVVVEPVDGLSLDGSARLLLDSQRYSGKPGLYADLFVQGLVDPLVLTGGVYVLREPYGTFLDEGVGGWLQATWRIRPTSRPGASSP